MGARVWDFDARSGADGPAKGWRGEKEIVHYDSNAAERTCIGYACHADCCLPQHESGVCTDPEPAALVRARCAPVEAAYRFRLPACTREGAC